MRPGSYFLAIVFLSCSCSEKKSNVNINNEQYQIAEVPDFKSFQMLNKEEDNMNQVNSDSATMDFKNNRFRLFLDFFNNRHQSASNSTSNNEFSSLCESRIDGDTLKIIMSAGFFSGVAVEIDIFKNNFQSFYDINNDNVKSLKYHLSDTNFADELTLRNKFQALTLSERPSFKAGQQLTGYLTFTSPVYFSKETDSPLDSNYVTGKVYFTCKTQ